MEIQVSNGVLSSSLVSLVAISPGANDALAHQMKGAQGWIPYQKRYDRCEKMKVGTACWYQK